jgi:PAS domain S-box-containing protein
LILSVAETGEVLDANDSFLRTVGFSREQIIGRSLADFGIWPGPQADTQWIQGADGQRELKEVELCLHTHSGKEIWFLTSAKEIDIGGRVCRLAQGVDITERKRLDQVLERRREELEQRFDERGQQLKESQAQLRESERLAAVGTLAAGIAHQINNPIGGIVAASEFALSEESGPEGESILRRALETALEEARRCGRIVKSVLQFARDEPTPKSVEDLSPTVRRACELARSYVEGRGGHLEVDVSATPLPVLMSPIDIEQVVLNLVRNAAESRLDGATVRVASHFLGDDAGRSDNSGASGSFDDTIYAELTVSDNGVRIPDIARPQVFDPFYTTRLEDGGSGLGLSVVHGVVGDHAGRVEIEPIAAGGTRFRILLPLAKTAALA